MTPLLAHEGEAAPSKRAEANRRNAQLSTGPKTQAGKEKSRRNALKTGFTGKGVVIPAELEKEAAERERGWAESLRPADQVQRDLVSRGARIMTILNRCARDVDAARLRAVDKADRTWEYDRDIEAERTAEGLGRRPGKTVATLRATLQGAAWMLERWKMLGEWIEADIPWSDSQRDLALDLLRIPGDFRDGSTPVDPPGVDPETLAVHRYEIVRREIDKLEAAIEEDLVDRDADDREMMRNNAVLSLDPDVRRLEGHERALADRLDRCLSKLLKLKEMETDKTPSPESVAEPKTAPKPEPRPKAAPARIARPEDLDAVISASALDEDSPGELPDFETLPPLERAKWVRALLDRDDRLGRTMPPEQRRQGEAMLARLEKKIAADEG